MNAKAKKKTLFSKKERKTSLNLSMVRMSAREKRRKYAASNEHKNRASKAGRLSQFEAIIKKYLRALQASETGIRKPLEKMNECRIKKSIRVIQLIKKAAGKAARMKAIVKMKAKVKQAVPSRTCLLYTSPSPRD